MVLAVIPTSFAGTVPVGAGDDEGAADVAAGADDEAGADDAAGALLVLLAELQPAATRAAAATAISPVRPARLRVLGPAPPRGGCSLPGLNVVPSMTSLPVSSARYTAPTSEGTLYRAVSKNKENCPTGRNRDEIR
jgi:hypothetical protein